jgi:exosortase
MSRKVWFLSATVATACACLIWLALLCFVSWQHLYYRFVPLALAGIVCLLWSRRPQSDEAPAGTSGFVVIAFLLSGVLLGCCAIVLRLPAQTTVALMAAVPTIGAMLRLCVGQKNLKDVLPAWAVLWLLIPLPYNWDVAVVQWLQPATYHLGSLLLDGIAVPHLFDGAALDFPDRRLLLANACRGAPSLFALLAWAGLFAAWRKMPLLPTSLLLVSAVFWAMLADILCVASIAVAYSTFTFDLTEPVATGCLFAVVFAIAVGMIVSTESGLFFLLRTVPENLPTGDVNPVAWIWNRATTGLPGEDAEENDPQEEKTPSLTASLLSEDESERLPDSAMAKFGKYFRRLVSPLSGLSFVANWLGSRCWAASFWAFPAIAAAIIIPVLCFQGNWQRRTGSPLALWYGKTAYAALEAERYHEAELWFQKLKQWDDGSELATYGLARIAESLGDRERARKMMQQIAPDDRQGYAQAHLWLVRDLVRDVEIPNARETALIEHHLLATVASLPGEIDAQETLGRMYLAQGRYDAASEHLAVAARKRPELLLLLARVHGLRGQAKARLRATQQAKDYYAAKVEAGTANVNDRLMLAAAQVNLGEYAAAEAMILMGLRQSADSGYRDLLVQLYLSWFDKLNSEATPDLASLLALIEKATHYAPKDPEVAGRLAMLATTSGAHAEQAERTLNDVLAKGLAPSATHFILGTLAAEKKDFAGAVFHLEQAHRISPQVPSVAGNLASSLAHLDPPQWERALTLANEAVSSSKDDPRMRGTRGYVLCGLRRYEEAITDLEVALRVTPSDSWIRETLANAYEALGDRELAAAYRRMAGVGAGSSPKAEPHDAQSADSPPDKKPEPVQKPPTK